MDDTSVDFEQADEDILDCTVSDEALEAAGGASLLVTWVTYGGYQTCC
jgi:hypothetical protein